MENGDALASTLSPSPLVDFVAGTAGGIASLLVGQPFDIVKTRLQAQSAFSSGRVENSLSSPLLTRSLPSSSPATPRLYRSATDAFRIIVRDEKFLGLFKGVTGPMIGVAAMNASIFGSYGLALRWQTQGEAANGPTLGQILLAGCASGLVSALITSPIELIKIREQMEISGQGARPHPVKIAKQLWAKGGIIGQQGLYRGFRLTCLRDLGYGPYFLCYEVLNRLLLSLHGASPIDGGAASSQLSNIELAISGAVAGVLAWLSTFPIDCVKTRVQASTQPASIVSAVQEVWAESGFRGFWRGVGPTVIRAIPVNATLFVVYEATKDTLIKWGY